MSFDDIEVDGLLAQHRVPGVAVAVVADGDVSITTGGRREAHGAPITKTTAFEAMSLTKPVFAYLVLLLAQGREFDLDRPIAEFGVPVAGDEDRTVTARLLLSHSAGLKAFPDGKSAIVDPPGSRFRYSPDGYLRVQEAIERVTGASLETLSQAHLFEPLDMTTTTLVTPARSPELSVGHDGSGRPVPPMNLSQPNAAASMLSTAAAQAGSSAMNAAWSAVSTASGQ
jgi:CubicO group peptidase (beta-lactamase class C family)